MLYDGAKAMMGGGSSGEGQAQQEQQAQYAPPQQGYQGEQQNPCAYELDQFLQCTKMAGDIAACQQFADAMKQCKLQYGMSSSLRSISHHCRSSVSFLSFIVVCALIMATTLYLLLSESSN